MPTSLNRKSSQRSGSRSRSMSQQKYEKTLGRPDSQNRSNSRQRKQRIFRRNNKNNYTGPNFVPRRYQNTQNTEKYLNDEYQNYEGTSTNPVRSPQNNQNQQSFLWRMNKRRPRTQDFKPFIKLLSTEHTNIL